MKPKKATKEAVIYCRVSSPDQVKNGHGLTSQETRCREFAKYRGLQVVQVFHEEGISGSLIDRPAMTEMLGYLRQQKKRKREVIVLIDDISRLARSLKAHIELRMEIQSAGGMLQSPSIEFGEDSDSQLVENLLASVSQHHRQKNAEQVKNRMRARMLSGYWIMRVPRGYKMENLPEHGKVMVRDEPVASIIQEGLEGFALNRFGSVVELKAFFEMQPNFPRDRKGRVHIQRVIDILNQKLYSGYFEYEKWGIGLTRGKHEPLISFDMFNRIQDKLHGREKAPARRDINEDFPLRGFVTCASCGQPYRGNWSKGRGGRYPYYLCHTKGCDFYGKSIKRDEVEDGFAELLQKITPSPVMVKLVEDIVEQARDIKLGSYEEVVTGLKDERRGIDRKIQQFLDRIITTDSATLVATYEKQIKNLEHQKALVEERIDQCGTLDDSFEKVNRTAMEFLANPYRFWRVADLTGKRILLKATFSRQVSYKKGEGYRTPDLSLPFSVLREFSDSKSGLVEPRRVELLTS
jgi:site-specific DNA recombinase